MKAFSKCSVAIKIEYKSAKLSYIALSVCCEEEVEKAGEEEKEKKPLLLLKSLTSDTVFLRDISLVSLLVWAGVLLP